MSAKLFVVSAPSGSGKTTLCNKLLESGIKDLDRSISMTTRAPRKGETDGVDYRFVTKEFFWDVIKDNGFLEYEENFGNLYGTPKAFVEEKLKAGKSVLLSIDVKGAVNVKKMFPDESVLIFIMPPSLEVLEERLRLRNSESKEALATRLKIAKQEMDYKKYYDYIVVNDDLETAFSELKKIITKELN